MKTKTYLTKIEQWQKTLQYFDLTFPYGGRADWWKCAQSSQARSGLTKACFEQNVGIGRIIRPHRLFLVGDLIVFYRCHGGPRFPVFCVSSKGYKIRYYEIEIWRSFVRPGSQLAREVEIPENLRRRRLDDSDVCDFILHG